MKKLTAAALAVCMTAGMMTGCSAPEPEETTAPSKAAESAAEEQGDAEAANPEDYKVALMIPGNLGDKSFHFLTLPSAPLSLLRSSLA